MASVVLMVAVLFMSIKSSHIQPLSYNTFVQNVTKHRVMQVDINFKQPTFMVELKGSPFIYETPNPEIPTFKYYLLTHNVKIIEIGASVTSSSIFSTLIDLVLMWFLGTFLWRILRQGKLSNTIESPVNVPSINFSSMAGNQEVKEELSFLVEFLKQPQAYQKMGAKLPKGIIFYGPPGTGKTLAAKAIAGEAGVPFFSIAGSDFVEMYVGVGAKRVRELFAKARKKAPCIIFVDEIDAVGSRNNMDSNSERDQTINALLKEMDGFTASTGVLVIAATNRLDSLDAALIRPGRFDRHIAIPLPDAQDRLKILTVHAKNKKIAEDVKMDDLSKMTIGFSGAGLESLLNEAAILAVTKKHDVITMEDIDGAFYKIVMKGHQKKKERKREEINVVAWHEAGHALTAKLLTDYDVSKVTIIPSTSGAGGVTFITPKSTELMSKKEIRNYIKVMYAGRVGELLLQQDEDKITNGASNDIEKATEVLIAMISQYGMSERFGMLHLPSFQAKEEIMEEAKRIGMELYEETVVLLKEQFVLLEAIASQLAEKETLLESEIDAIMATH
jgi:cell division protease FtsH